MKSPFSAIVAIGAGVVVLVGYFIQIPGLTSMRATVLSWGMLVAAVAAWIGIGNLLSVHWKKVSSTQPGKYYSLVLVIAFAITLLIGIVQGILNPSQALLQKAVDSIQVPVEASFMAILAFSLVYAGINLLRRRRDTFTILFLVSAVIFMILGSGLLGLVDIPFVRELGAGINRLPIAGSRGILLGVALGGLATGLRVLLGADRPYGG